MKAFSKCETITFHQLMSMRAGILDSINYAYAPSDWQYLYCLPESTKSYDTEALAQVSPSLLICHWTMLQEPATSTQTKTISFCHTLSKSFLI